MKNRHGTLVCNNCHRPTTRVFGSADGQLWDLLSCGEACDEDLSALLDGVPFAAVAVAGRSTDCSCVRWCAHCVDPAEVSP